jgi:hypothetical protein
MRDILFAAVAALAFAVFIVWHLKRARTIARVWARANGYEVIRFLWTVHLFGPFPFQSPGKQVARRMLVKDASGNERVVWLLLGDWFLGLLDDTVKEVAWES